jgi:hypothetical protein
MYKWRTKWLGKWTTTRYLATEDDMRKRHPDAIRLDDTLKIVQVPETEAEIVAMGSLHTRLTRRG